MNVRLNRTSTFAALQNPVYRKLWFAILLSGTCVAAQDTAATWTMNMLGSSTFLLSPISTVAALPFFLFTLSSGSGPERPVCFLYLCYTGADTCHRAEGTSPSTLQPRSAVYFHGGRFGFQRSFRASAGTGEALFEYAHRLGKFAYCVGLCTDGACSPETAFPGCRGACRCGMDTFSF